MISTNICYWSSGTSLNLGYHHISLLWFEGNQCSLKVDFVASLMFDVHWYFYFPFIWKICFLAHSLTVSINWTNGSVCHVCHITTQNLDCRILDIFSLAVLEGIAIGFDPNYKVLSSSYPWIARKVLTDSSPQLRSTLHTLLYKVFFYALLLSKPRAFLFSLFSFFFLVGHLEIPFLPHQDGVFRIDRLESLLTEVCFLYLLFFISFMMSPWHP